MKGAWRDAGKGVWRGRQEGRAAGRREVWSRLAKLRARYGRGEITLDGFFERVDDVFDDRCDVCGRSG